MREDINQTDWEALLTGSIDHQVGAFTNRLISLQSKYVPCQTFKSRPTDQPWFGYRCREAADLKSRSWRRLRANNTRANQETYKTACKNMAIVQRDAISRWKSDMATKLSGQSVGRKEWWSGVRQQQGLESDSTIPPLTTPSGGVVTRGRDKAELLASHFSDKMCVPHPTRAPPRIPLLTTVQLNHLSITKEEVLCLLTKIHQDGTGTR